MTVSAGTFESAAAARRAGAGARDRGAGVREDEVRSRNGRRSASRVSCIAVGVGDRADRAAQRRGSERRRRPGSTASFDTPCPREAIRGVDPSSSWLRRGRDGGLRRGDPACCGVHRAGSRRRPGRRPSRSPRRRARRRGGAVRARATPRMRAPEAPIGWPRAIAPPLTLTFSSSMPSIADRVERHRGERLVDLPQVDVVDRQARLVQRLASRPRPASWRGRRSRWPLRVADDLGQHLLAVGLRPLVASDSTSAPAPSLTPGELPAVWSPPCRRAPGSSASVSSARVRGAGPRRPRPTVSPLRDLTVTGTISSGRRPSSVASSAQLVAAQRPPVQVRAGELELVADLGRLVEHLLAGERVGQAVVHHRVERLGVAHAVAEARLRQQVRGAATSTPCRRRRRLRRRRRGSPGRR